MLVPCKALVPGPGSCANTMASGVWTPSSVTWNP